MFYIYLIKHNQTKEIYIGKTINIDQRLTEHNSGHQTATKRKSGNWELIYLEAYKSSKDCDDRELKLKHHGSAKRKLKDRIKISLEN